MAGDIKNKTASIYIDDAPALAAYDRLSKKADDYNKKIDEGTKKAKFLQDAIQKSLDAGGKPEALQKKLADVNKELDNSQKALAKVTTQQKALQQQIDSKSGPSLKQQQALVSKLVNEYKLLGNNTQAAADKLKEIGAQSEKLQSMKDRLSEVTKAQKESASGFGSILKRVTEYFGAYELISKASEFVKEFFSEAINGAMELERENARLKNTLTNLGQGEAFDRIKEKVESLTQQFQYLKEADVTTTFSKLISYGKLTEKQMDDLLPVIINFAAQQRIDLPQATDLVTQALEGNSRALKTYGINLSATNTPAERLRVIMTELKSKVDGAGEAFEKTAAGGVAVAREQFNKAAEDLGTNLLPILAKTMNVINDIIKGLRGITKAQEMEQDNVNIQVQGLINDKLFKIQQQIKVGFINPKTGKPVTAEDYIKALEEQLPKLDDVNKKVNEGVITALNTKTLGGGDPNYDPQAAAAARKKAEEERKKILEDQKKFLEELRKLNLDYGLLNQSDFDKEISQAIEKYNALKSLAHGNAEELKQLEEDKGKAIFQIQAKYAQKELDDLQKKDDEQRKQHEKQLQDAMKAALPAQERLLNDLIARTNRSLQLRRAQEDYQISKAYGKQKLDLQLQQLDEERTAALAAARAKGESVEAVDIEFQKRREDLEKAYWQRTVETYLGFAQQVLDIISTFENARTSKENAALARQQNNVNAEKAGYQKMLNSKLISQQEFNKKVAQLDSDFDSKKTALEKKQFERNKKLQIAQAVINGAQAELKTLSEFGAPVPPNFLGIIASALTIATTIAQIAAIKKTEYTGGGASFEKGGHLTGPRHKDGGMPVINPRTGKKEAEVEGGEVILSRKTVANNRGLVEALLYNSMHRDGARIDPWFKTRTYKGIDFNGISRSIQRVRHYESGGVFTSGSSSSTDGGGQPQTIVVPAISEQQQAVMEAILQVFSKPIRANVVYNDIKQAADTVASIQADATFAKK